MKKKFKIDEIYREKLKGIETTPPGDSWEHILAGLPEKNKRRILPFWYGLATTAAALAILFLVFNDFPFYTPQSSTSPVTVEQHKENFNPDPTSAEFIKSMNEAGSTLEMIQIKKGNLREIYFKEGNSGITTGLADLPTTKSKNQKASRLSSSSAKNIPQQELTGTSLSEEAVFVNSRNLHGIQLNSQPVMTNEFNIRGPKFLSEKNELAYSDFFEKPIEEDKKLIPENTPIDNRFSLTTNAGAVYLDQFGKGNLLASQFDGNKEGGKMTASYGVYLAYQLSTNLKIRGGLYKVDFSYGTENISYLAVLNAEVATRPMNESSELESIVSGSLDQNFSLLEIPMEMEYTLIKKKIELNLIGGVSSFLLQENNISFTSDIIAADLGEGKNLEEISFSANLGLGLNYHITRQFQFNIEPIFKYQLNTFKHSLDVNSYYIGVYSGLRFKF